MKISHLIVLSLIPIFLSSCGKKPQEEQQPEEQLSYYDTKVAQFTNENPSLKKNQIVFIGDSITDGYPLNDYYSDLGKEVYNRGISGDTTEGVINRLKVSLYDIEPSKIVLLIGINDMNMKWEDSRILTNYETILSGIKTNLPNAMVYPLSITPMNKTVETYAGWINAENANKKAKELNVEIENLANKYSYTYLDLHSKLVDSEGFLSEEYSPDGIHFGSGGFAVWTNLVKPYLQ